MIWGVLGGMLFSSALQAKTVMNTACLVPLKNNPALCIFLKGNGFLRGESFHWVFTLTDLNVLLGPKSEEEPFVRVLLQGALGKGAAVHISAVHGSRRGGLHAIPVSTFSLCSVFQ